MSAKRTLRGMAWLGAAGAVGTAVAGAGIGLAGIALWRRMKQGEDANGKVALVTGASRGLGLEMARQLAQQGAWWQSAHPDDASPQPPGQDPGAPVKEPPDKPTSVPDSPVREPDPVPPKKYG